MESVSTLAVVVLTYNEEQNLPACLESLKGLDCEIFVVDSGSTDGTREIATQYGAKIFEHLFETHAKQWDWALRELPISTEWVFGLDADQRVTPELREEIIGLFNREGLGVKGKVEGLRSEELGGKSKELGVRSKERVEEIDGFYIKRRQIFRGRWIRHGGYYPKYLLKLFKRAQVRADPDDLADHHFYVAGRVAKLRHDLIEENKKENDISFWVEKHNRYAAALASEELHCRNGRQEFLEPSLMGNPDQRTLWLKRTWLQLPLYLRPFLYFVYRYFLRLGILDGKEGFIFHFLQAFWFRLLVDIKLEEMLKESGRRETWGERSKG